MALISLLITSCGGKKTPSSVDELSELANGSVSKELVDAAPAAWAEAKRYLALAEKATEDGDTEQADRFAKLGAIHAKIARARAEQALIRKKMLKAEEKKQQLQEEISVVAHSLRNIETRIERERMREHLEKVVVKTRLAAAAEEELRERLQTAADKKARSNARTTVGLELIERAQIWREIVDVLVKKEVLDKGVLNLVDGPLTIAQDKHQEQELAAVQQYVEESGIESRRLVDEAWENRSQNPADVLTDALKKLKKEGFQIDEEEFGPGVSLLVPSGARSVDKWSAELARVGKLLAPFNQISCIVLAHNRLIGAKDKGITLKASAVLTEAGLSEDRVKFRNTGKASPVTALRREGNHLVVLLVPAPSIE